MLTTKLRILFRHCRQAFPWLLAAAVLCALILPPVSLPQTTAQPQPILDFDLRTDHSKATHETLGRQRQRLTEQETARVQTVKDKMQAAQARVGDLEVIPSTLTGGPELISAGPLSAKLLTPPSTAAREDVVRDFIERNAPLYGLTAAQVGELERTADYLNPAGNLGWVTLEQKFNGIPVFAGELRACLSAEGELVRTISTLATGVNAGKLRTEPSISAAQAVALGAASIGVKLEASALQVKTTSPDGRSVTFERGPFDDEIKVELVYFPLATGLVNLAWAMTLWQQNPAYYTVVDAELGDLFFRKNITNEQSQPVSYTIYNDDSPAPLSPSNVLPGAGATQAPGIQRTTVTLIGNEAPYTFNNFGWMTDHTNITTGNNVDAGLDIDATNGIDDTGRAVGVNRVFNFAYNPAPLGAEAPTLAAYRNGVVTDLFYWTNVYHDRLYLLGFTEQARNFQNNNFGRGGIGADYIRAEAQDASGTNNASFATPADGLLPRMQMFVWTPATPDRDGSLEHDIVLHELTHGLSNRLHNNAAGLTIEQSRALGEGWSDFYARALLSSANEDVNGIYPVGPYVSIGLTGIGNNNYYYGIRRFPYAVRTNLGANGRPHNPITFADIDPAQISLTDGAFPPAFVGTANQVHNAGEVWAMALLEMRARIINRLGFAEGNQRALQLVTDGMKLDPVNPNMIQARDSIVTAACTGFGGADEMDIWNGFAARGLGFSARYNNLTSVTEAFDQPNVGLGNVTFSDAGSGCNANGIADPGETLTLTVPLNNVLCSTDITGVTVSVVGGGTASYGTLNARSSSTQTISYMVPANAQCGATINVTININSSLGTITRTFPLSIGQLVATFSENFDSVTPTALPAGWTTAVTGAGTDWLTQTAVPDTPPNYVFTSNRPAVGTATLTSPNIAITSAASRLSFRQFVALESGFDGGVLEIKIGSGAFTDILTAGGSFQSNGYNATLATDSSCTATPNPLTGRRAWTGNSTSIGGYFTTVVNLPAAAAGQMVQFRWIAGYDCSEADAGWRLDTISVTGSFLCTACPAACPTVTGLNPAGGAVGSQVTITGTNFLGVTAVRFSNNVTATFTVVNATTITATVPAGAVPGPITISKTGCPDVRSADFTLPEAVFWTNLVNTTVSGDVLRKTGGADDGVWDGGAVSRQAIASGNGFLEFRASGPNVNRAAGLHGAGALGDSNSLNYAIVLTDAGSAEFRESGSYLGDVGYVVGDLFRVAVEGGTVKFYKNGVLQASAATAPVLPLRAAAVFSVLGGEIAGARILGSGAAALGPAPVRLPTAARPQTVR